MQHAPSTGSPPPRIEPTGFFTGVQIVPVIMGVVVDVVVTYLLLGAFVFGYVARKTTDAGEPNQDAVEQYMESTEGLAAALAIGLLGTAVGGFIAARRAGTLQIKHGAFVGVGSLIVSFVQMALQEAPPPMPEWFTFVSVVGIIPAGALGGYVAELLGGARPGTARRRPW
jgi:putative membrane protein (TIGR04086 family)